MNRPMRPCLRPGCPALVQRGYCDTHKHVEREADARRGSSRQRGYTREWEKARAAYLAEHPLCVECQREGRTAPATVVDHIVPHRGDMAKFWDVGNWQSMCDRHHRIKTGRGQ